MLKLDLHVHTKYSNDGFEEIVDLIKKAKKIGLDGFAITDHDTVAGLKEAKKLADKENFLIIPGIEIASKDGDIVALGINKKIPKNLSAKKTINKIHEMGGIAIAAHPFGMLYHRNSVGILASELPFDAVEAINSRCYSANNIAQKIDKTKIAGSDAHIKEELGRAYTLVNAKPNIKSILNAIKAGKTKPIGKSIRFTNVLQYAYIRTPTLISEKLSKIFGRK
ncbi:PHP domain-containing protein [Candidatus Woesearchaeota archaeon]|nr:PHP domain-containing protein [Candidatus Woesearchaeota archaeon]